MARHGDAFMWSAMTAVHVALGMALGALGAWGHLAITRRRARWIVEGRSGLAWGLFPLGLLTVGALLFAASRVAPVSAWCFVIGVFAMRAMVLARSRESR